MVAETAEDKKAVFRRLIDCYARADVDAMESLIAPSYLGHTSAGDRDWAGFRQSILNFHAIFDCASHLLPELQAITLRHNVGHDLA